MMIVPPTEINETVMTNCNIVEDEHLPYNPATNYNAGDKCIHEHKIHECAADNTVGIIPGTDATKWLDKPPATNRYAMFDTKRSTVSSKAEAITMTFNIAAIQNAIAFKNVDATSIQVVVNDADEGEVYNVTESMIDVGVSSFYDYLFKPVEPKYALLLPNLPPYLNATIDVTIAKPNGTASVGIVVIGTQYYIGELHYGMSDSFNSWSTKKRDLEGDFEIIGRNYSDLSDFVVRIETRRREPIKRTLAKFKDSIILFVGKNTMPDTMIYGVYESFGTIMDGEDFSTCNISVEGVA